MKLDGKRALVTGAGQGIGQAIAIRFAQEGADVAIDYPVDRKDAESTAAEIEKLGRRAPLIQRDVSKCIEAERMVEQAVTALGGLDILVNNAGIERNASFLDISEQNYRAVLAVD